MNSAFARASLERKRVAVQAWLTDNGNSPEVCDYRRRLDDAIDYLCLRVERHREGCPDCGGVTCFASCPAQL